MKSGQEIKALRELNANEADMVSGGFIGETVSNKSSPPQSTSEPASNSESRMGIDAGHSHECFVSLCTRAE